MTEYEAKLLLPALVEKSGHNQDKIRQENRELLRKAASVYGPAKVVLFIKVRRRCCRHKIGPDWQGCPTGANTCLQYRRSLPTLP